ncbi:hypothetical protein [Pseudomarimonas salicorniae]|uniref:Phosphate-selective porin O and P n=1 Tax=Pseudomarimonas salicorniae TaxID=2933270 RepID=A0ABT0GFM3_9GAMM|nr:hypothetical protein [Lysobacter sp. CAU 1642]MCK7593162.1 hypothetical protein [Lysobacter sp. CAU 1642]
MTRLPTLVLLFALGILAPVSALASEPLRISGFLSQGYLHTSQNPFFRKEEGGSFDWQEAGITASKQFSPLIRGAAQLTYRRAGDLPGDRVFLDFALIEIDLLQSEHTQADLQLGRVKVPLGLFNETRDVPQTRLGVLPPASVYYEALRELSASTDGARIDLVQDVGVARVQLALVGGRRSNDTTEVEFLALGGNVPGELPDVSMKAAHLALVTAEERLRLVASHVRADLDYEPSGPSDPFAAGSLRGSFSVLSAEWQAARWYVLGEYSRQRARFRDFGPLLPDRTGDGEGYYTQFGWRTSPALELFGRREHYYASRSDRSGTEQFLPVFGVAHLGYSKSWVAGLRYDITPAWTLRASHHWIDGTGILPRSQISDFQALSRKWELFAASVSFRF